VGHSAFLSRRPSGPQREFSMSLFPQIHVLFRMMSATAATTRRAMATTIEWRKSCLRSTRMDSKERPVFSRINKTITANTIPDVNRTTVQRTMATWAFDISLCYPVLAPQISISFGVIKAASPLRQMDEDERKSWLLEELQQRLPLQSVTTRFVTFSPA